MQRIFGTLEPTLNRIGALMTGLKLEVLEKSIPVIEWATAGLFNLWDTNKETVFGWIEQIPTLLRNLTVGALSVGADILEWLARIWPSIEALGQWVMKTVAPTVAGAMDAMGIPVPGGSPQYDPGSPEAETYNASRRRTKTIGKVAGWVADHPVETAAIALLGPTLLKAGVTAAGKAAWSGISGLLGGGAAATAEGGAAAAGGAGWLGTAGRVLGTAGRWLAGGAAGTAGVIGAGIAGGVALPYYALGMGGALGDVRTGAQDMGFEDNRGFFGRAWDGIRGTFGASTAESRWIEQQAGMAFDPNAPRGPGVPPRRVEGSVPDRLQDTAAYPRDWQNPVKQGARSKRIARSSSSGRPAARTRRRCTSSRRRSSRRAWSSCRLRRSSGRCRWLWPNGVHGMAVSRQFRRDFGHPGFGVSVSVLH